MSHKLLSIDSLEPEHEDIEKCLNCKKPECTNCLGDYFLTTSPKRIVLEADKLAEWYNEGKTNPWIALRMGTHIDTIRRRFKEFGLGFTQPRPVLTKEFFEALPKGQRKYLTWKGERMA